MEKTSIRTPPDLEKNLLHWLLQITKAINYNLPARELFEIYKNVLRDHLRMGKLLVFIYENSWQQLLSFGVDFREVRIDIENDLDKLIEFEPGNAHAPGWVKSFDTIVPVIHNDRPLGYAFLGDCALPPPVQKSILPYIHTITNIIVVAIENKRLTKESLARVAMQKELQLAAEMQNMLFPDKLDGYGIFDVAATYLPHQEVGGDYYDFFPVGGEESIICMADVSGKGMAAALLMSNFQANLRARATSNGPLQQLVTQLNHSVFDNAKGEKFITVFLARINHRTGELAYVNAGHNPPFILNGNKLVSLEKGTTGLGMFADLPFITAGSEQLPENGVLVCYTDGITDLENNKGDFFGLERLHGMVRDQTGSRAMSELNLLLRERLNEYRQDREFNDDVTLLTMRRINR